jgi:ABC-type phosphate transport system substrate-binding protein
MPLFKAPGVPKLAMLLALAGNIAAAEVVAVVSPQNPTTTLSRKEVSNIFLGKTNRFPNGQPAVPIDQAEGSQPRQEFYRNVSNQQPADLKAYWSRMIFTGRGQPPMVVDRDEQVKKALAGRPTGIGYIDRTSVDDTVKVLAVQ